jgi:DNA-binding LacI/PurR family transcriptional regulator
MTVSNAYNRPDQLSPGLRTQVLEKARELGYPGPDPLGRGLRQGRTGALGVLYDTSPSFVFQDAAAVKFLEGLSRAIERAFLGLLLVPGPWPDPGGAAAPLETALVDGFVVYSVADTDPQIGAALARRPTVIVDQPLLENVAFVGIDDAVAAQAAAEHLLELGHRRIAVITFALRRDGTEATASPERRRSASYAVTRTRLAGYHRAFVKAGLAWEEITVYECPGSNPRLGYRAARHLLTQSPRPTALLATSDALAIGALRAAQELGLHTPSDLSVIGFDDTAEAQRTNPPLTTVHQPHAMKGQRAGELLLELIKDPTSARTALLPAELIIRKSTARPPAPSQR